jgi:hypothetical protein
MHAPVRAESASALLLVQSGSASRPLSDERPSVLTLMRALARQLTDHRACHKRDYSSLTAQHLPMFGSLAVKSDYQKSGEMGARHLRSEMTVSPVRDDGYHSSRICLQSGLLALG